MYVINNLEEETMNCCDFKEIGGTECLWESVKNNINTVHSCAKLIYIYKENIYKENISIQSVIKPHAS